MSRTVKAATALAAASLALAACGSPNSESGSSGGSSGGAGGGKAAKVGMAYDVGGRGDQSFNDAAARGLDQAKSELGVETKESVATAGEPESAREERLQQLVEAGYTNVVAVGFAYAPAVKKVAADNPEAKFAIVDSTDAKGPNIQNIVFSEQEGSYLAGVVAAKKSKTGSIGFVGGVQTDLIKKFEAGFLAGAKATNPNIKTQVKYLTQPPNFTGFADPAAGKTAAEGMLSAGADVIYHAAGGSGSGVFTAVKAKNAMAIGVDSDQAKTAQPDVRASIITSVVKRVDVGVLEFVKQAKDGKIKSGEAVFDLKSNGVELATTGGKIDDLKAELDKVKADIISGKIVVPSK
ncbi:BMP family lipoprotein [Arsenicicoccus sp. oral taxon 190]|uniref:BMP family lipoprotein n=1 Tax=Arsenicicoccus sp. oral taxon 190 TaxID=1658671 RepID=UPI00067A00B5|nr:BMP family ABC transporter substrate-binding protein [Arsenicicoccus sp. oral taxon 190]AKT52437.1 ABC transporter substrate-binding protein [Arsenicicoccus sp. oral taxon 190]